MFVEVALCVSKLGNSRWGYESCALPRCHVVVRIGSAPVVSLSVFTLLAHSCHVRPGLFVWQSGSLISASAVAAAAAAA